MSSNNVVGDLWIGGPMRRGPMRWGGGGNEMGDQWVGGTNEMGDQRNGWCMGANWGTNEMGDQWDGGPMMCTRVMNVINSFWLLFRWWTNFSTSWKCSNSFQSVITLSNNSFLNSSDLLQSHGTWNSSSTKSVEYKTQALSASGVPLYRRTSTTKGRIPALICANKERWYLGILRSRHSSESDLYILFFFNRFGIPPSIPSNTLNRF